MVRVFCAIIFVLITFIGEFSQALEHEDELKVNFGLMRRVMIDLWSREISSYRTPLSLDLDYKHRVYLDTYKSFSINLGFETFNEIVNPTTMRVLVLPVLSMHKTWNNNFDDSYFFKKIGVGVVASTGFNTGDKWLGAEMGMSFYVYPTPWLRLQSDFAIRHASSDVVVCMRYQAKFLITDSIGILYRNVSAVSAAVDKNIGLGVTKIGLDYVYKF
ncbi:MAG: hypothetical protein PUN43_04745 [Candidatus Liberibacter asiaticus]|nr:hypothetical protein [Candidatus Liberibacter asiaticus]QYK83819.1 hypothetical protein H8S83_04210 [Candidatus Liberibacter asiaticus]